MAEVFSSALSSTSESGKWDPLLEVGVPTELLIMACGKRLQEGLLKEMPVHKAQVCSLPSSQRQVRKEKPRQPTERFESVQNPQDQKDRTHNTASATNNESLGLTLGEAAMSESRACTAHPRSGRMRQCGSRTSSHSARQQSTLYEFMLPEKVQQTSQRKPKKPSGD